MKSLLFSTYFRSSLWEMETPLAFVFWHHRHQIKNNPTTCSSELPLVTQAPMNMLEMRRIDFPENQLRG